MNKKEVRGSLMEQLRLQNKTSDFYEDLVNDYMDYWSLKKKLIADIRKKGLRYETVNGNGITVEKPNESVNKSAKDHNGHAQDSERSESERASFVLLSGG